MMDNELGYIITATEINHDTNDVNVVALAEDSYSGGYCYWTKNINSAKMFTTVEKAKEYNNCSFEDTFRKHNTNNGIIEIRKPCKIQRAFLKFETITDYK